LDDKLITEAVRLGSFKTKQEAVNAELAEFVAPHNRRRILELAGQIEFEPKWDYKRMRGRR
jgi:Arc/MetJ family transcription regulator